MNWWFVGILGSFVFTAIGASEWAKAYERAETAKACLSQGERCMRGGDCVWCEYTCITRKELTNGH
jgi:hypothetical protein